VIHLFISQVKLTDNRNVEREIKYS